MSKKLADVETGEVVKVLSDDEKNGNFVQVSRQPGLQALTRLSKENPAALQLFLFITEHMDGRNALAVSRYTIAELTEKSLSTIDRSIKYLKQNGYLTVLKIGSANAYVLNSDIVWSSYANQRKYCKFEGTLMLGEYDNKEEFERLEKSSEKIKCANLRLKNELATV